MRRKINSFQDLLAVLKELNDMPLSRANKCETLYGLAGQVNCGRIVELGTYHGIGAISLYYGAVSNKNYIDTKIMTVDEYVDRSGWANEPYSRKDLKVARANFRKTGAKVSIFIGEVSQVYQVFKEEEEMPLQIGLLFWDTGSSNIEEQVMQWQSFIVDGGTVALHDTGDGRFGSADICDKLVRDYGYSDIVKYPGGVITVKKINKETM